METTENKNLRNHFCGGRKHKASWILLGIVGFTAFAFLFGAVVMWLWNSLMPVIFHLGLITFWQAVGLAILGRLLFGNLHHGRPQFRGHHKFGPWKHGVHMNDAGNCRDYSNSVRWNYYEQYWNEEGEKAFNDYVKRKSENPV
ncbi:MAG: hypothetical protein NTY96_06325 [Bacteroidetes bacterium]|nr:hypothetical protein [Bacteroidota bacterium]